MARPSTPDRHRLAARALNPEGDLMTQPRSVVRVGALADVHCGRNNRVALHALFGRVPERADVLVMCGDLTDHGLPDEARALAKELAVVHVPMIAVLGNHDFEAGKQDEIRTILEDAAVTVLDGDSCDVQGIGFAGVKGFCGGFGQRALAPWGEEMIKRFVHEAIDEALKLESGLARLTSPRRVVLLHYSPIEATVEGEAREIFPFLGSSRLEEPLNRHPLTAVFHGHAHQGTLEGRTRAGVPVYNVACPLLERSFAGQPAFRVIEIGHDAARDERPSDERPSVTRPVEVSGG
jgi:Icc-related predicted phosphoesterase